jgi:hypothetical protein
MLSGTLGSEDSSVYHDVLHVAVTGSKGPLAPDGLDMAKEFAHRFIASMAMI